VYVLVIVAVVALTLSRPYLTARELPVNTTQEQVQP